VIELALERVPQPLPAKIEAVEPLAAAVPAPDPKPVVIKH
jgi:hypothetical protein